MAALKVESIGIAQLLDQLRSSAWLVPTFQRDFVWSDTDVTNLVLSIIEARPIGMATLWEQPDDSALELESVGIPDSVDGDQSPITHISELKREEWPKKFFAILDGRQRCTAIAMAFGGLRSKNPRRRFSGRWFLDVSAQDASDRVKYLREQEIRSKALNTEAACITQGLFPLSSFQDGEELFAQWMRYLQAIYMPSNYPGNVLPESVELKRRDDVLKRAFNGVNQTLLAIYVVPPTYSLGDICEIFETLNTSGTKVSTVDLLHSWLYAGTQTMPNPVSLRDWIDELGQTDGATGWSSRDERPELVAQMVTASYLAMEQPKAAPRQVGRRKPTPIVSIKAGDMLATPPEFWLSAIAEKDEIARFIGDFQIAVAGGRFSMRNCPYPVTIAMYVGIRWYMAHEPKFKNHWDLREFDSLFRAFFWRNVLATRYDQGFLTQSATDLKVIKELLYFRASSPNSNAWANHCSSELSKLIEKPILTTDQLIERLTDVRPKGAVGQALVLPMIARATSDLIDGTIDLSFPHDGRVELHHIYPKDWSRNNRHGRLEQVLDPARNGPNFVESIANLIPLSRESNSWWRARSPGQALREKSIVFNAARARIESLFISSQAFELLMADPPDPLAFWTTRAKAIADHLTQLTVLEI